MIVEYIRYQLTTSQPQDLMDAYAQAGTHLRASPDCLSYELTQCSDDPRSFILRIEWTSAAGHVEGFRKSPDFTPFLRTIRPFFKEIVEMRHYEPGPAAWRRDGG